jgi:hypothetical protein
VGKLGDFPPVCGRVISGRLCTLIEAQTVYSLADIYALDEILTLQNYHEWLASRKDEHG